MKAREAPSIAQLEKPAMDNPATPQQESPRAQPRDAGNWAEQGTDLHVTDAPANAINLNVEGRRVVGPMQGFGPLWQKTYQVRLPVDRVAPTELVQYWKDHFGELQPRQNRFYAPRSGVTPGQVVLMNASAQGLPVNSGLLILYADNESFTFMTPQGCPEAGWITCSSFEEEGATVAQVRTQGRSNDPIFEFGFRLFGARQQERIWSYVLAQLASRYEVSTVATIDRARLDPRMQWNRAGNVWHNATIRSFVYMCLLPARSVARIGRGGRHTRQISS
jgi:hypothetical protein